VSFSIPSNYSTVIIIIIIIIIIVVIIDIQVPYFTAAQLVPRRVRVSLIKHSLFTLLPKTS
jgi:hypothetical protein